MWVEIPRDHQKIAKPTNRPHITDSTFLSRVAKLKSPAEKLRPLVAGLPELVALHELLLTPQHTEVIMFVGDGKQLSKSRNIRALKS